MQSTLRIAVVTLLSLSLLLLFGGGTMAQADTKLGVGLTPAHFPHQSGDDVAHMFQGAHQIGSYSIINFGWKDVGEGEVAGQMIQLSRQFQLTPVLRIDIFGGGKDGLALPSGVSGDSMADPEVAKAFVALATQMASLHPDYLSIGIDVNRFLAGGVDKLVAFSQVYKQAYAAAKEASPSTKVYVSFNLDIFQTASREQSHPLSELRKLVDIFRPNLDVLEFDSMPLGAFKSPGDIPAGYYEDIKQFASPQDEILVQTGWPSASPSSASEQLDFIKVVQAQIGKLQPKALFWPILHDIDIGGDSPVASLGLYDSAGTAKPAAAAFTGISPPQAQVAQSQSEPVSEAFRKDPTDKFGVYVSSLGAERPVLIVSDPKRELNHARISPDLNWVVFTRYNIFNPQGEALEGNGYVNTEAVICHVDGSECSVVIPARAAFVAANANWTPDGKSLLFVSNDTPSGKPAIKLYNVASHAITPFYLPDDLIVADPHQSGNLVVMPGRENSNPHLSRLYLVNAATKSRKPLTNPQFDDFKVMEPPMGDHDPKLSPDGSKVAVMRHIAQDEWHIVVVDTATRAEADLSAPGAVDAVPEWSSDGHLLIFWAVDRRNMKNTGLSTMRPDGSERQHLPLPPGFFYTMPAFFPGSGSGPSAKIIYSTQINPKL